MVSHYLEWTYNHITIRIIIKNERQKFMIELLGLPTATYITTSFIKKRFERLIGEKKIG